MLEHKQWVLASSNKGKLTELNALLSELGVEITPQQDHDVTDAVENGAGFIDNALIKARHASLGTGLPAIADDSGLVVNALNGAPGIHSARYAGEHGDQEANNAKLLQELADTPWPQRQAAFHCCLVATRSAQDPVPVIAHGIWHGVILEQPLGQQGFGYDPLFWIPDEQASAAELSAQRKNALSHRGQALRSLFEQIRAYS